VHKVIYNIYDYETQNQIQPNHCDHISSDFNL